MTPTGTFVQAGQSHPARQIALEPYVRRIRTEVMRAAGKGRGRSSLRLRIGTRALDLDAWILEALLETSVAPEDDSSAGLLVQVVAFAAKSLHDSEALASTQQHDVHRLHALQAEALLNVALGTALLRELKERIDTGVLAGEVDHARDWNRLRETLDDIVGASKRALGNNERGEAERLSWEFSGRSQTEAAAAAGPPAARPPIALVRPATGAPWNAHSKRAEVIRRREPREAAQTAESVSDSPSVSAWALAVVVAVVGLGLLANRTFGTGGAPGGNPADPLPGAARLERFEPRALSASARVRDEVWSELDERARLGWVNDLGRELAQRGAKGFLLRTATGKPVASWLAGRGAALLDARDVSAPEAPAERGARQKLY